MLIQPLLGTGLRVGDPLIPLPAAWECDLATNALRWSPGVYDLFGIPHGQPLTRDEVVGMYTPESQALLREVRDRAVAEGASFTIDVAIRRRDGALRKMRLTADVECENGRPVRLYGTKQDVTDE
ncbi:diguanylate cyclase [Sphingomonas sp. ABOLD]|uniref:PAS domain-containing protein n=1 Tax=Sphingomonas trueperi TaxID=53317 RepID=A0A7X6BC60_9SPHN|nr:MULTISPECIES: PAS domain-containing protein [Sphingomonas]NJB96571.1 PAS domain-containing protein [Sphingomonas trueperi]RSV40088.1 diguanylate cyclase [Sphingomonas sp. ABOLE]RSV46661.1 diguanylate cyclase [Sphingomonas sp. ABOLD]